MKALGGLLARLGGLLGPLGGILDVSRCLLAHLGGILEASWELGAAGSAWFRLVPARGGGDAAATPGLSGRIRIIRKGYHKEVR